MGKRYEICLSGTGGQGQILAGIILAEAVVNDELNVVQTQSYGPEARGGASKAEVIIGDSFINYPKVLQPDYLVAMSQEACNKYAGTVKPGGMLIVDADLVSEVPANRTVGVYYVPITRIAREEIGKELVANMVSLGVLVGLTGVVSKKAVEDALLERVPRGTEELNMKALHAGFEAAQKAKQQKGVLKAG